MSTESSYKKPYTLIKSKFDFPDEVDLLVLKGKQYGIGDSRADLLKSPGYLSKPSWLNLIATGILATSAKKTLEVMITGNDEALFPLASRIALYDEYGIFVGEEALERRSKNTRDSAHNVPRFEIFQKALNPAVVTVSHHAERTWRRFHEVGVDFRYMVSSEDIVSENSIEDSFSVDQWRHQFNVQLEIAKEAVVNRIPLIEACGSAAVNLYRK